MASRRLIMTGLILILLGTLPFCGGASTAAAAGPEGFVRAEAAPPVSLSFKEGLLFLEARDADIRELLRAVAEKAGIDLTLGEGVGGKVSLTLSGVSLEEALRRLCQSRAILYEYDPQTRIGRIIGAGAFTAGSGLGSAGPAGTAVSAPAAKAAAKDTLKGETGQAPSGMGLPQNASLPGTSVEKKRYDSQGRLLFKPRELLVRFRPEATDAQMAALHQSLGSTVLKSLGNIKLHRVLLRDGLSEQEGKALYRASAVVSIAERHALRYPMLAPNDPYYTNNSQWGVKRIQMPDAWSITTGNANVTIGVIDTGVDTGHPDFKHPDLSTNLLPGWDFAGSERFVDGTDADNNPMDRDGHGTHVAGIIAAVGNNGVGVAGIGWNLRIMPLKVLADDLTTNPRHEMETFDIVAAIEYAILQGVRLVNCSFGGEAPDPGDPAYLEQLVDFQNEYDAFDRLRQHGILAVCAAGNAGVNNDTSSNKIYPASHDLANIISVAASLNPEAYPIQPENLWSSSNYGHTSVDLMAPGSNIYSTYQCPASGECNSYRALSGTSMAAPHVSGVAGLILSRNPGLSHTRVKSVILENVDEVTAVRDLLVSGGRLNAAAALGMVCLSGDLTGDGRVGLGDVILALRIAAGLDDGSGACQTADVNRDDLNGLAEAIYGLRVLSGFGG